MHAGTAIDDQRNAPVQLREDGAGRGGADGPKAVRTRCGDGFVEALDDAFKNRVAAHAHGNRGQAGGDKIRHAGLLRQHKGQRPRPEALDELDDDLLNLRRHIRHRVELLFIRQMHNERIKRGPLLGLEDLRHRRGIQGIGGESVNRLCRQSHDIARTQQPHRLLHGVMQFRRKIGGENGGSHERR